MRFPDFLYQHSTVWLVWLMVIIAEMAVEIVVSEDHPGVAMLIGKVGIVAVVSAFLLHRGLQKNRQANGFTVLLAFLAMTGPLIGDPLWKWVCGHGHAFELKLIIGLRNLTLVALLWAMTERFEKLAALLSLFSILFCVSTSQDSSMPVVSVLYISIGIIWLCTNYWASLKTQKVKGQQKFIPWFSLTAGLLLLITILMLFALPESRRARLVAGILPSSGGDGAYDPFARSGIGDGENLVAGTTQAMTFAPLEEAPFIEGTQPSLYDVVQETYGEARFPRNQQRSIALSADQFKMNHHRMAQARKSAKAFALHRKGNKTKHRHADDTNSDALFHLVGRVPVHLRHTVYDLFDGQHWYPEELQEDHFKKLKVEQLDDKPWITWEYRIGFDFFAGVEPHALRIINFDTNQIVSPVNTIGVHIDQCDRVDLFQWIQSDIIGLNRQSVPNLSVVHVQSRLVDESRFQEKYPPITRGNIPAYNTFPNGAEWKPVRALAERWSAECRTDWQRIQAISLKLKENYTHDPDAIAPEDCENPVCWFLFEKQAGPDYLFATAAVMLFRSLGISCRAVSGFYADDENYDISTQQTSVYKSNVHWWPEVYLGAGCWQTVEPTPGFSVLQPKQTFLAQIASVIQRCWHNALVYWPVSLAILFGTVFVYLRRKPLLRQLLIWQWVFRNYWFGRSRKLRSILLETIALWDRQLQLSGSARPGSTSVSKYLLKSDLIKQAASIQAVATLSLLSDWALYSASDQPPFAIDQKEVRRLCYQWLTISRPAAALANTQHKTDST